MIAVAFAKTCQRRHIAGIVAKRFVRGSGVCHAALHSFNRVEIGKLDRFTHVTDDLIRQQNDGGAILLRQVECLDRQLECLCHRNGAKGNDWMISVCAPACLHHIAL